MFEIYLTETPAESAHAERIAEITAVDDAATANDLCMSLQPYLREGVEAHFVSA